MALLRAGREAAAHGAREPRGSVTVSVPFILSALVTPTLARLTQQFPSLAVQPRFSDRLARLVDEQVDVAIRMGELADSSLVARLLGRRSARWPRRFDRPHCRGGWRDADRGVSMRHAH